jgi:putative FmdB family regulatory protein
MPTYEYACRRCGHFEAVRPMAEYDLPEACPDCGQASPRTLTLPSFASMDAGQRIARSVNERSANAPRSSAAHRPGCSCCRPAKPGAAKGFPGARPWMISH